MNLKTQQQKLVKMKQREKRIKALVSCGTIFKQPTILVTGFPKGEKREEKGLKKLIFERSNDEKIF